MQANVTICDQGTVVLFRLNTDAAEAFVEENVHLENWQWLGNWSFAAEHRFAWDVIAGM